MKAAIIDFDKTIFNLNIDWKAIKRNISKMSGLNVDKNLLEILKIYTNFSKTLTYKIDDYLEQVEMEGMLTGSESKYGTLIKEWVINNDQFISIIVSRNSTKMLQNYFSRINIHPNAIFGRTSIKSEIKPSAKIVNKVRDELEKYSYSQLFVIGDSYHDKYFSQLLNARFISLDTKTTKLGLKKILEI